MKKFVLFVIAILAMGRLSFGQDSKVSFPVLFNQYFPGLVGVMPTTTLFTPLSDKVCFVSSYVDPVSLNVAGVTVWIGYTDTVGAQHWQMGYRNSNVAPINSLFPVFAIHALANTPITVNADMPPEDLSESYNLHVSLICQ